MHADAVDRDARFPREAIDALRKARLMSALVPREMGGHGSGMIELAAMCETLAQQCVITAMVFAMHQIQVASILRHAMQTPAVFQGLRVGSGRKAAAGGVGHERGWNRWRAPHEPVRGREARWGWAASRLEQELHDHLVPGAEADDILFQARRAADSPPNDQVVVLVRKPECTLTQKGSWDTLGMRGTCSPPFLLESRRGNGADIRDAVRRASRAKHRCRSATFSGQTCGLASRRPL